ncbi:hypothetical protein NQ315_017020 [Exocentrus adspersus]|uniref:Protein amnionless n=1 Tax=Exocentrus adspersus TaxID=1586481 RepID=A0AAV8VAT8_9CUCU|nr:hypothetical protein NQ315_017020 [Exocentrus adspersus]
MSGQRSMCCVRPATKTWKHDSDVLNPDHWVGGKPGEDCEGFDMSNISRTFLVIDHLSAKEIVLPKDVTIYLPPGTEIDFRENDPGILNCVRLKKNFYSYAWIDPENWLVDHSENLAIPHLERIPCDHDDVVFPKGWKSSLCFGIYRFKLRLKSFKFGEDYLTNWDLRSKIEDIHILPIGSRNMFIDGKSCDDRTGCVCTETVDDTPCLFIEQVEQFPCLDPITPIGFCTKMCGAVITVRDLTSQYFLTHFTIDKIQDALAGYSSHTHVSKVLNGTRALIQIVFTEKEFSGTSLDEAKAFDSMLLSDYSFGVSRTVLTSSGPLFIQGEATRTALSMVFGSLCGVLLVFALIFFINSSSFKRLNLNRYSFTSRPLVGFLAKYENTENEGLIFERASMGGSVISLEKSFDNPMFGEASTASTSYDTFTNVPEGKAAVSEISLENPMYDITSLNETASEVKTEEENQLVNLTRSEE